MRALVLAAAVLAYLLLVGGLAPSSVSYDGLAFLLRARAGEVDYGHALYVPLLGAADALTGGTSAVRAGQLLSAAGGAVLGALLVRRLARGGTPLASATLVAALLVLSTLPWQEAGALEPTTWTLAALLAAGEAAAAYGRRPGWGRLAALGAAFLVALGFHVVSLLAVPWIVRDVRAGLMRDLRASGARVPRAHALGVAVVAALVVALAVVGGELGSSLAYWAGFLPRLEDGVGRELAGHLARGGRLVLEGAPILVALALGCALAARAGAGARGTQDAAGGAAWLALPYALAFVALGKPLVGLLAPVLLAAALRVGKAARGARTARFRLGLAFALALQLALSVPQALAWNAAPDVARARAGLVARHLPEGKRVLAGPYANHLRFYHPELAVADVTELVHHARARDRDADPIEVLRAFVARSDRPCVLASDAAGWLLSIGVDPEGLGLRIGEAFLVPEDPRLWLHPL